ncbi:MAG: hypothetical protein RL417_2577 [Pseudomonadota bacterium]|jgi:nicotinamide-nucleotide amidase
MPQGIAVLATGSELLDGRVVDTNSQFIAGRLADLGLTLQRTLTCGDDIPAIVQSLEFLSREASFVVVTGGLGPTTDDLTREALAEFAGQPLVLDAGALDTLKDYYARKRRSFDPSNTKQATFPASAAIIPNPHGTAAAFVLELRPGFFAVALPGVPGELRALFESDVVPLILSQFKDAAPRKERFFRLFGLPESIVGARVHAAALDPQITVSYRAHFPEIHVVLKTAADDAVLEAAAAKTRGAIEADFIVSEDKNRSLEGVVAELLQKNKATVAVAESCTGGLLGGLLTRLPGASKTFLGGAISYSNALKESLLGVSAEALRTHGAVSEVVATAMARGARERFGSTYALSITGVAGPEGGSPEKPVGTFFVGISTPEGDAAYHFFFNSTREWIRTFAANCALDILRRTALALPIRSLALVNR